MTILTVNSAARCLTFETERIDCALGRSGVCPAADKQEGDGCTPIGEWPLRAVLFRPGRSTPPPGLLLPWRWIGASDGWSDDPRDPQYNRPVRLPHRYSAEALIRDDPLYDIIVIFGHNDAPPEPGKGSAIFFHIWRSARPTEGCVAIARHDMDRLLPRLTTQDRMRII